MTDTIKQTDADSASTPAKPVLSKLLQPDFLGYSLDLDYWRAEYDAVLAEHGGRECVGYAKTLAEFCSTSRDANLLAFIGCCHWLNGAKKTKSVDRKRSTYGLKHDAERLLERRGGHCYVSQFVFEMAALHEGYRLVDRGPCVHINMCKKDSDGAFKAQRYFQQPYWFADDPIIPYRRSA